MVLSVNIIYVQIQLYMASVLKGFLSGSWIPAFNLQNFSLYSHHPSEWQRYDQSQVTFLDFLCPKNYFEAVLVLSTV